jgi:hypothetical protein
LSATDLLVHGAGVTVETKGLLGIFESAAVQEIGTNHNAGSSLQKDNKKTGSVQKKGKTVPQMESASKNAGGCLCISLHAANPLAERPTPALS